MTVAVHVHEAADATVVTLDGAADGDLLAEIGDTLAAIAADALGQVVVDLDRLTLFHPDALHQLVDHLVTGGNRVALVASRSSMRSVLRRWGITARIPVHRLLPASTKDRR